MGVDGPDEDTFRARYDVDEWIERSESSRS